MDMRKFSEINLLRTNEWHKNGIDEWSVSDWAVAMVGEAGEACNQIKKYNRLRTALPSNNPVSFHQELLADELADTFIYLDLLATRCGLSLEDCVRHKFNKISERENLPQRV